MPFFTPEQEQAFNINDDPNYIIPVIASFSKNGGVKPLYFQFDDKTIKIESVHWCDKRHNIYYFECSALFDNYLTDVNLTFYPDCNRWTMKPR